MKKLLFSAVVLGILSMLPLTAQAVCDRTSATIIRVSTYPGGTSSYIYYRDSTLSNRYFYCTTTDAKLLDAATDALGDNEVWIRASNGSCPTHSTGGAFSGTCQIVINNP